MREEREEEEGGEHGCLVRIRGKDTCRGKLRKGSPRVQSITSNDDEHAHGIGRL
ncbi:hypothetical protein D3C83_324810 [compost metagenome]